MTLSTAYADLVDRVNNARATFNATLRRECEHRGVHLELSRSGDEITLQGDSCQAFQALEIATKAANEELETAK